MPQGQVALGRCSQTCAPGDVSPCAPWFGQPTVGQEQGEKVKRMTRSELLFWGQRGCGFELAGQLQATAKALSPAPVIPGNIKLHQLCRGESLEGTGSAGADTFLGSFLPWTLGSLSCTSEPVAGAEHELGAASPAPRPPCPPCSVGFSLTPLPRGEGNKRGGGEGKRNFFQLLEERKALFRPERIPVQSWSLSNPQQCGVARRTGREQSCLAGHREPSE